MEELSIQEQMKLQQEEKQKHQEHIQEVMKDLTSGSKEDLLEIKDRYQANINTLESRKVDVIKAMMAELSQYELADLLFEQYKLNSQQIKSVSELALEEATDKDKVRNTALVAKMYKKLSDEASKTFKEHKQNLIDTTKPGVQMSLWMDSSSFTVKRTEKEDLSFKDNESALIELLEQNGLGDLVKVTKTIDKTKLKTAKEKGLLNSAMLSLIGIETKEDVTGFTSR